MADPIVVVTSGRTVLAAFPRPGKLPALTDVIEKHLPIWRNAAPWLSIDAQWLSVAFADTSQIDQEELFDNPLAFSVVKPPTPVIALPVTVPASVTPPPDTPVKLEQTGTVATLQIISMSNTSIAVQAPPNTAPLDERMQVFVRGPDGIDRQTSADVTLNTDTFKAILNLPNPPGPAEFNVLVLVPGYKPRFAVRTLP